jgi:hypothetical protein
MIEQLCNVLGLAQTIDADRESFKPDDSTAVESATHAFDNPLHR